MTNTCDRCHKGTDEKLKKSELEPTKNICQNCYNQEIENLKLASYD